MLRHKLSFDVYLTFKVTDIGAGRNPACFCETTSTTFPGALNWTGSAGSFVWISSAIFEEFIISDDVATVPNVVDDDDDIVVVNDDIVVAELDTSVDSFRFGQTQFVVEGVTLVTSDTGAIPPSMSLLLLTSDPGEVGDSVDTGQGQNWDVAGCEDGIVELDSNGRSDDEFVWISPDGNEAELLLSPSEVDKLIVDCSITASGERSDVAFSILVAVVTSLTTCCSDEGSSVAREEPVWLMADISLVLLEDAAVVSLILAVVPSSVDKSVLIDVSGEVEFVAADAAVIFNACSGINVAFSVLFSESINTAGGVDSCAVTFCDDTMDVNKERKKVILRTKNIIFGHSQIYYCLHAFVKARYETGYYPLTKWFICCRTSSN